MKEILIDPEKNENADPNLNLQEDDKEVESKGEEKISSVLERLKKPILWEEIVDLSKKALKFNEKGTVNLLNIRKKTEVIIRKSTINLNSNKSDKVNIQIDEMQGKKTNDLNNSTEEHISDD